MDKPVFQIENGIPIPPKQKESPFRWGKFEIGNSVFVAGVKASALMSSARRATAHIGFKWTTREVMHDGVRGVRIWRVS